MVSRWRFGRTWSEAELQVALQRLRDLGPNFHESPERMVPANGWTVDGDDAPIGWEPPGPPLADGPFARAKHALITYDFSDRTVVVGHFDPRAPLSHRDMLLEIKVLGFRFLNGVRVHTVRDEPSDHRSSFGFRYDTLEGHIEEGFEWFLLSKNHETGELRFRIQAHWRLGHFPNWWSRVGFVLMGWRFRQQWRRTAIRRLRALARQQASAPVARPGELAHRGDRAPIHRR